jgi:outer membrane immunogenic protein
MKNLFFGSAALLALAAAGPVGAADMPAKAPVYKAPPSIVAYNWTGFYVGAHVGGGWSTKDWFGIIGGAPEVASPDPSGWLGGLQAGFNWQTGRFVLGVEGQISGADLRGSDELINGGVATGYFAHTDVNMVATLAARFGVAFDHTLFYVKGGAAWVNEDHWITQGNDPYLAKTGVTRTGWMVGAGIEQALWSNWSAKVEYNYMNFGSYRISLYFPDGSFDSDRDLDQKIHVVKFGINYRFGDFGKGPVAGKGPVVTRY